MNYLAKILILAILASGTASAAWEALPTVAPAQKDNPTTEAKVGLGKMLYFDPRLSATARYRASCA